MLTIRCYHIEACGRPGDLGCEVTVLRFTGIFNPVVRDGNCAFLSAFRHSTGLTGRCADHNIPADGVNHDVIGVNVSLHHLLILAPRAYQQPSRRKCSLSDRSVRGEHEEEKCVWNDIPMFHGGKPPLTVPSRHSGMATGSPSHINRDSYLCILGDLLKRFLNMSRSTGDSSHRLG